MADDHCKNLCDLNENLHAYVFKVINSKYNFKISKFKIADIK